MDHKFYEILWTKSLDSQHPVKNPSTACLLTYSLYSRAIYLRTYIATG